MLFSDKSFCVFQINGFPLPPKNFTILTQKIKPVEEWKDAGVYCQYYRLGFSISRRLIFAYHFKTNGMVFCDKSFCVFEINAWLLPRKNFTILTQKNKTSRRVERYRGLLSILGWDSKLSGRLIFRYHFETNRMLFPDKSFFFLR